MSKITDAYQLFGTITVAYRLADDEAEGVLDALTEAANLESENAALRAAADNMKAERDELRAMCDELAKMLDEAGQTCPFDLYAHSNGMPCEEDGKNCTDNKGGECWAAFARYRAMTANEKEVE